MKPKKPHTFSVELSSQQKQALKALGHHLKPIVQIGSSGCSPSVLQEIQSALEKHELIKIQMPSLTTADEKKQWLEEFILVLPQHVHVVSKAGRIIILYFEQAPEKSNIRLSESVKKRKE